MSSIENISGLNASSMLQTARGSDSRRAEFEAKFNSAALAAGLDSEAAAGLQDEIKAAIAAAKETSDTSSDPRQGIQNAIDGVLQKHGVDLEQFKSQMQAGMGGPGGAGGPSGPPPGGGAPDESRKAEFESKLTDAALASGLDSESADELQEEIQSAISDVLSDSSESTDPRQAIQDAINTLLEKHGVDLDEFKSQLQALTGESQSAIPLVDEQA